MFIAGTHTLCKLHTPDSTSLLLICPKEITQKMCRKYHKMFITEDWLNKLQYIHK